VNGSEHREIGDTASGGALVNVGGEWPQERFWLGYGDVMALSGDYFTPRPPAWVRDHNRADGDALAADDLFGLARVPGAEETKPGTRDEIVCALRVMTIHEAFVDPRFEPGGEFADFDFGCGGSSCAVERRVRDRDRYLMLAATNDDHSVAPGGSTRERLPATPAPFGSAVVAYRRLHQLALEQACRHGRSRGDLSQAMAREAAAQHVLTDAFTAGHMRTPVALIRRYWRARYPAFWENLQRRVAADTATALRELAWALQEHMRGPASPRDHRWCDQVSRVTRDPALAAAIIGAMRTIEAVAATSGSRAAVWALLADVSAWEGWGSWSKGEVEGGAEQGMDSVRVLVSAPFRVRERVTEWVPHERMAYELIDGMRVRSYRATVTLEQAAEGGVVVRWRSTYDHAGPFTSLALRLAVRDACKRLAKAASAWVPWRVIVTFTR
jgi:hypothetical protein